MYHNEYEEYVQLLTDWQTDSIDEAIDLEYQSNELMYPY